VFRLERGYGNNRDLSILAEKIKQKITRKTEIEWTISVFRVQNPNRKQSTGILEGINMKLLASAFFSAA
jgi:hypothetical protein